MIKDTNSYNYQERNLSDVFKELQEIRYNPSLQSSYMKSKKKRQTKNININKVKRIFPQNFSLKTIKIDSSRIIAMSIIVFICVALIFNKKIFAKSNMSEYEINNNALNIQNIIAKNANINTFKEQAVTEYTLVYSTIYSENPSLPEGEEIIKKEGTFGKQLVTSVKTYENENLIDELVLSREDILEPTSQKVEVGTSKFLAKHCVHIGDTMYLVKDGTLKKSAYKKSADIATLKEGLDVKLLDLLSEQWCKVSFDNKVGYIQTSYLTSVSTTPYIIEKNRIARVSLDINIDMKVNKSTGLTKNDYKKILTGLPQDVNGIFKDNYEVFYNVDKKYNINGIFLAAIAIHESEWGTSAIANDKKNLFGYGAYDNSPYDSSYEFEDYAAGIETVGKALVKYYLNPAGTKIYDNEIAEGTYYNTPTVEGVNIRYASDTEWYTKVFSYMQLLYDRL